MREEVNKIFEDMCKLRDRLLHLSDLTGLYFNIDAFDGVGWAKAYRIEKDEEGKYKKTLVSFENLSFSTGEYDSNGKTFFETDGKCQTREYMEMDAERLGV